MNKITWHKLQVLLVINLFLITFNIYGQIENDISDYQILNDILKNQKQPLSLKKSNSNIYVINQIKILQEFEINKNYYSLDSIKQSSGISRDSILRLKIFHKNSYSSLIRQLNEKSMWNIENIKFKTEFYNGNIANYIFVSKPIYINSKENSFAIVQVDTTTLSYISIYKKNNAVWMEYKLIFPLFKHSRVKLIEN